MDPKLLQTILPLAVIAFVMALRLRSMKKARPLKVSTLWVPPVFLVGLAGATLVAAPLSAMGLSIGAVALIVGGLIGWQRGKFMHIEVDPATDSLLQRPSRAAMLLLVALIVVRMGAKSMMPAGVDPMHGTALMLTDGLLGMALGLLSATRAEMYLRGRKLLAAARNDPAAVNRVPG